MAQDPLHSAEEQPDEIGTLLRAAFPQPLPTDEFAILLADRLDAEFTARCAPHATNGRAPAGSHKAVISPPSRGWRRRIAMALAIAASLLLAAFAWNLQPRYTWAAMIRALENQPWIGAASQGPAGKVVHIWLSQGKRNGSVEAALLDLLLEGEQSGEPAHSVSVEQQSWRKTADQRVHLDVRLRVERSDREPEIVDLELLLNSQTYLPFECRLTRNNNISEFRLDYSAQRPAETSVTPAPKTNTESLDAELQDKEPHDTEPHETEPATVAEPAIPLLSMVERIDEQLEETWQDQGIQPLGHAPDAEFLRRLHLDLTGRIPTVSEVRSFLRDARADRHAALVDELLASHDHASHLAALWRQFLLPDGVDLSRYGGVAAFEEWLTDRFHENVPYDELVRELLLAQGRAGEKGPVLFYTAHKLAPEELAGHTARAFLGIRIQCAQCHDHFFDDRWKQTDFWAYAAFFAHISRPKGKVEMISPLLPVRDTRQGEVTLPDSDDIVQPRFPLGEPSSDALDGTRRERLAVWLTADDNLLFARATVNRVWAHLFGRGFVNPVDDMRDDNAAICPEVLDDLADYFIATRFDLRKLLKTVVLTHAYQLTSAATDDDPSRTLFFAQMNIKPFTAEQLYDSIVVAARLEQLMSGGDQPDGLLRLNNLSRQTFLEQFRAAPGQTVEYQAGIPQALTLMNGQLIHRATDLQTSGIVRALAAPFFADEERLETLFLATLSRLPDDAERALMLEHVQSADDDKARDAALGDVLWALLNSAEFTLNH